LIRLRVVEGVTVALDAAFAVAKAGDLLLDNRQHRALQVLFDYQRATRLGLTAGAKPLPEVELMEQQYLQSIATEL
jgi:hypothetical protein